MKTAIRAHQRDDGFVSETEMEAAIHDATHLPKSEQHPLHLRPTACTKRAPNCPEEETRLDQRRRHSSGRYRPVQRGRPDWTVPCERRIACLNRGLEVREQLVVGTRWPASSADAAPTSQSTAPSGTTAAIAISAWSLLSRGTDAFDDMVISLQEVIVLLHGVVFVSDRPIMSRT